MTTFKFNNALIDIVQQSRQSNTHMNVQVQINRGDNNMIYIFHSCQLANYDFFAGGVRVIVRSKCTIIAVSRLVVDHDLVTIVVEVERGSLPSFHLVSICKGFSTRATEVGAVCIVGDKTIEFFGHQHLHEGTLECDGGINWNFKLL